MLEMITLTCLTLLFLSIARPGKTPPLPNPLRIERGGRFRATLAPQLNLAQPLIAAFDDAFGELPPGLPDTAVQCFEISDRQATAHGQSSYWLALALRGGYFEFHALPPEAGADPQARMAAQFSPVPTSLPDAELSQRIRQALDAAATLRQAEVRALG